MPLRWVLFDVGDVLELCGDGEWPRSWAHRCAERLGIGIEAFDARVAGADLPPAQIRDDVEKEYWRLFGEAVGADDVLLARMVADFWDAYCGQPNTELVEFARSLRGTVGLAILSNSGDGARREEERRYGYSAIFNPICYSHEIGVTKPDTAAYVAALDAMGASADEVLFIDNAPICVEGARKCGFAALLHEDNATTMTAVREGLHR